MTKIISLTKLSSLSKIKKQLTKIVLVTGCFDLLHKAHKEFLKAAKSQGDLLIVGLEQDSRIKKLKGKDRPINSFAKRARNLAQIKEIDYVFPLPKSFNTNEDHWRLLQLIKPRVLAVSQNSPHLEEKKKLIRKIGGQIFIFPFNQKFSTTSLLTPP